MSEPLSSLVLNGFNPTNTTADIDLKRKQRQLDEQQAAVNATFDFGDQWAAISRSTLTGTLAIGAYEQQYAPDSNYELTQSELDRLATGIDPRFRPAFAGAVSSQHAEYLREKFLQLTKDEEMLAQSSEWIKALYIGTNIADPTTLAAGLLTGGAGEVAGVARAVGTSARLASAAKFGAKTAAVFGGLEAGRASLDPRVTTGDILRASASGFGFGMGQELTIGAGFVGRSLGMGGGGAVGSLAADATASMLGEEVTAAQALINAGQQLAFGTLASGVHSVHSIALDKAARNAAKDGQWAIVTDISRRRGVSPESYMTPEARTFFKDQIRPTMEARNPEGVATLDELAKEIPDETTPPPVEIAAPVADPASVKGPGIVESAADKLIAEGKRLRKGTIKRGPNTGATTLPADLVGLAMEAAGHVLKSGIRTAEAIKAAIQSLAAKSGFDIEKHADALAIETQRIIDDVDAGRPATTSFRRNNIDQDGEPLPPKRPGDLDLSTVRNMPKSWAGAQLKIGDTPILTARYEMGAHVGQSPNQAVRDIGAMSLADPIPRKGPNGDVAVVLDADAWAAARTDGVLGNYFGRNDAIFAAHIASAKQGGSKPLTHTAFFEQVSRAVRRPKGEYTADANINAAADELRSFFNQVRELAVSHRAKGFDKFGQDDTYFTRIGSRTKIDAAHERFGDEAVHAMVRNSSRKALAASGVAEDEIDDIADVIAKAWLRDIGSKAEPDAMASIELSDPILLSERVKEILGDSITEKEAAILAKHIGRAEGVGATLSVAKARTAIEETHVQPMTDKNGVTVDFGIEDLIENNAEVVAALYGRRVIGQAAITEVLNNASEILGKKVETIAQLKTALKTHAKTTKGYSEKAINRDIEKIEIGLKLAAGIPLYETTDIVRVVRTIRNLNYGRLMSHPATGARNFFEISGAMAELGHGVVTEHLPAVASMFKRAENGELSVEVVRELAMLTGLGEIWSSRRPLPGLADQVANSTKIEDIAAKFARVASASSLTAPGQTAIERIVGKAITQRWAEIAKTGKRPSAIRRLGMGITDEAMLDRIGEMLRTKATWSDDGLHIVQINFEKWTDAGAGSAFRNAVQLQAHRLLMVNQPSAYAKWMTGETGKVLAQLRTFAFGAWSKKFLYNVRMMDAQALNQWIISSIGAAAGFALTAYLRGQEKIGKDKADYLRKNLSAERIVKAGFSQAAYSSLLPMAVDTAAPMFGFDEVFSYARTTGQSGSLLDNPTFDWGRNAWRAKNAVFAPFNPHYNVSRADVRAVQNGLWIPRVVGVQGALDQLTKKLPKESKKRPTED